MGHDGPGQFPEVAVAAHGRALETVLTMKRRRRIETFLAAGLMLMSGCSAIPGQGSPPTATPLPPLPDQGGITAEGRLEPIRHAALSFGADGIVSEVLIREGDVVEAGQVIGRLDNTETRTLEQARAHAAVDLSNAHEAVRVAQQEFDDYPVPREFVGFTPQQATEYWLDKLDTARADFEPYEGTSRKTLKPNNNRFPSLPRRLWFDTNEYEGMAKEYKKQLDVGWMNYRKAVAWLTLDSALESAQARLTQAQSDYDALQAASPAETTAGVRSALASAELRAPFAGSITNLDLKEGERVTAGNPVATIGDFTAWVVKTTDLTEIDVVEVSVSEPVGLTLDAIPGPTFQGRVLGIDQNYSERQGDIVYTCTLLLADRLPEMRWGMTAQVTFQP
jgi:multidrug efflux pump subunit AcrA (membrane-fusion protein)